MTLDNYVAAKRWLLGGLLVFVLWQLAGSLMGFGIMLNYQHQQQQEMLQSMQRRQQQETLRRKQDEADYQAKLLRQNRERTAGPGLLPQWIGAPPSASRPPSTSGRPLPTSAGTKLTSAALVLHLRELNAFGLAADPKHLLHCTNGGSQWDYVCFVEREAGRSNSFAQFGAVVDREHVIELSKLCPLNARLPAPLNQTSR